MRINKNLILWIVVCIIFASLFQGCAQKTRIKALKAAKVTDESIKYIGVAPFTNDNIAQASQIDAQMGNVRIDGEKYFTLIDRDNINKIMEEKKLNDSGLVDLIGKQDSTGLSQMKTLLTGDVNLDDMASSSFREDRTDYSTCVKTYTKKGKSYCSKYRQYTVLCRANLYSVKTKVKLIKVANAKTIFTKNYEKNAKYKHCGDDNVILPSKKNVNTTLAKSIAKDLMIDIAPSYVYFTVTLLDSIKIDVTSVQKTKFKIALKMIDLQRMKKAKTILKYLNKQLKGLSYVVLYDLAITYESLGDIQKAFELLKKAEDITLEQGNIVEEISIAIKRVEKNIKEKNKAIMQL